MRIKLAARAERVYPSPWAIWLPGLLALAVAGLLFVIDEFAVLMGSWDTPQPGLQWLSTGANGQWYLALAAVVALAAGATHPVLRRGAALVAWGIIGLEVGWFVLTGMLSS